MDAYSGAPWVRTFDAVVVEVKTFLLLFRLVLYFGFRAVNDIVPTKGSD